MKIASIWRKITNIGIEEHELGREVVRIRLLNQLMAFSFLTSTLVLISYIFAFDGYPTVYATVANLAIQATTLYLSYRKKFGWARFTAFWVFTTMIGINVINLGGGFGEANIFMAIGFAAFIIYEGYRKLQIMAIVYVTAVFIGTKLYVINNVELTEISPYDELVTFPMVLIILGLIIFLYQREIKKFDIHQKRLIEDLKNKNERIAEQYASLKVSNADRRTLNEAQKIGNVGSWTFDFENKVLTGSPQLLSMMGLPLNMGNLYDIFLNYIPAKYQEQIRESISQPVINQPPIDFIYDIKIEDEEKWFRLRGNTILDKEDGNYKFVGTIQDITERVDKENKINGLLEELKLNNEKLKISNNDLENFASVASHDLQEPLRTIGSFVQLLEEENKGKLDEDSKSYIQFINDGVNRMYDLIDALLTYSRVGKAKLVLEKVELEKLIHQKIQDLTVKIKESNAKVVLKNIPKTIVAEPHQLGIVFYNLINNGIKFNTSKNPTVSINCEERSQDYLFSIKDNGIGIDAKNHSQIFEIFKRLHRKEEYKGTGIGLASVRRIVEKHGGEIWLESELGKGTTFFFTIPKTDTGR